MRIKETAGWDGVDGQRKESRPWADIYSVWSTRPEPGRGGLAPAPEEHRDDTEVRLKGQDPSWRRGREDQTVIGIYLGFYLGIYQFCLPIRYLPG